MLDVISK